MHLPRRLLLVLSMVSVVVAAGAGFYVVQRQSPDAAMLRLYIDIGLAVTLALIVVGTTSARPHLLTELAEALRALSLGDHGKRLDADDYGSLEDVARAYNEAAAALSEMDDPNLGPVKTKPRRDQLVPKRDEEPRPEPKRTPSVRTSAAQEDALSDHPEIGEVRPLRRSPSEDEASAAEPSPKASAAAEPSPKESDAARKESDGPAESSAAPDEAAMDEAFDDDDDAPTILEPAPDAFEDDADGAEASSNDDDDASDSGAQAEDGGAAPDEQAVGAEAEEKPQPSEEKAKEKAAGPIYPSRDELRALFDAFVARKKEVEADVSELEFESFADTLEDESRRLVEDHKCRGIRFEITIESGEVSLLPHLLR